MHSLHTNTHRPTLTQDGPLAIEGGVHPIIGSLQDGSSQFVPNSLACGPLSNFVIVSGANGSGKSTLLKQVSISVYTHIYVYTYTYIYRFIVCAQQPCMRSPLKL